ncbi:MAG TPA: hypothetical protein VNM68_10540 [Candidatus Polarisedimenticolia bacterium]|nr:hypothetical protein [Candidatus Polarisedimenticolia bacterium]
METKKLGSKVATSFAGAERRREPRLPLTLSIGVTGFDRDGRFFTERTSTFDVSNLGCRFPLHAEMGKDSVVAIRVIRRASGLEVDSPPVLFRLAWVEEAEHGWTLGAEQLQPGRPWSVHFSQQKGDFRNTV